MTTNDLEVCFRRMERDRQDRVGEYRRPNDCIECEHGGWGHVCGGCGTYLGHEMGHCPDKTCVANAPQDRVCAHCHRTIRVGARSGDWFHPDTQRRDCLKSAFDDAPFTLAQPGSDDDRVR